MIEIIQCIIEISKKYKKNFIINALVVLVSNYCLLIALQIIFHLVKFHFEVRNFEEIHSFCLFKTTPFRFYQ